MTFGPCVRTQTHRESIIYALYNEIVVPINNPEEGCEGVFLEPAEIWTKVQ